MCGRAVQAYGLTHTSARTRACKGVIKPHADQIGPALLIAEVLVHTGGEQGLLPSDWDSYSVAAGREEERLSWCCLGR